MQLADGGDTNGGDQKVDCRQLSQMVICVIAVMQTIHNNICPSRMPGCLI